MTKNTKKPTPLKDKQNKTVIHTNHHDQFFKTFFSEAGFAQELFQLIFSKEEQKAYDWKKLKTEKDSFPDNSRADLVFSVPLKNKPKSKIRIFILLEHKSTYDIKLFQQLFRYQNLLIEKSLNEHGKPVPIIPVVFYHGRKPWKWNLSFQEALGGKDFLDIPVLSRKSMLNFKIKLLDIHDKKLEKIFKDQNFKSRGILYLLKEVWSSKVDLAFLKHVFHLCKDIIKKQEDMVLSIMEYLVTGYKMKPEVWKEAEAEVIKEGLLKKGGHMDIKEYIAERARQEGWQKGWKKGRLEGQQAGRLEGQQAGRQEGQQVGRQEVVLNMLKNKMDTQLITKVTGLSEKEINKLKNGKCNDTEGSGGRGY